MKRSLLVATVILLAAVTAVESFGQIAESSGPMPVEGRRRRDRVNPPLPPLPEPQPQPRPDVPRPRPEPDSNFDRVRPVPKPDRKPDRKPDVRPLPLPDLDDLVPDIRPNVFSRLFVFVGRVVLWAIYALITVVVLFATCAYFPFRPLVEMWRRWNR